MAGWLARIDRAIGRVGTGLLLILLGSGLLWWNEGRFAAACRAVGARQAQVPELKAEDKAPAELEGRLVQVTGIVESEDGSFDADFGFYGRSIRRERRVQCCDGQRWRNAVAENAALCLLPDLGNESFVAKKVRFGRYWLPPELVPEIGGWRPLGLKLPDQNYRERLTRRLVAARPELAGQTLVHVINDSYYLGRNPRAPEPGDMRISFLVAAQPAWVTVLGRLHGNTFAPYPAEDGTGIFALAMGRVSMAPAFAAERERNRLETWGLRGAGALLVICGLKLLAGPLTALASPTPILGAIVGTGTGLACTLLGLVWSLAAAAVAWLRFRPSAAAAMLALVLALTAVLYRRGKKISRNSASKAPDS